MTATPMNLIELGAAGVPLDELFEHVYADPATRLLHRDRSCAPRLASYDQAMIAEQSRRGSTAAALASCPFCCYRNVGDALQDTLSAFDRLHAAHRDIEHHLLRCERGLGGEFTRADLTVVSDSLSHLRPRLDPALRTTGTPDMQAATRNLPPAAAEWFRRYLLTAQSRSAEMLERYLAAGLLADILADARARLRVFPQGTPRSGYWYVAERFPPGPDPASSRILREVHLAYTPAVWLDQSGRPVALYRLPGEVADLVLRNFAGPNMHDGGPALPEDTAELLAAAAAIFDGTDPDAPLSDAATVLAMARQVLATEGR